MSPLDSMFLLAEDGITHMHVGSCAVFEGPAPAYDDVLALIAAKLPRIPRYRQKVRVVPGGLGRPVWVDDPHFNLEYHVRHTALPPPGSDADLDNLMGRVMSQELDRHRPLWEAWMVEGLTDDRWALVSKVHHCMVDGVSGTQLITILLDRARDPVPAPRDRGVGTGVRTQRCPAHRRFARPAGRQRRRAAARAARPRADAAADRRPGPRRARRTVATAGTAAGAATDPVDRRGHRPAPPVGLRARPTSPTSRRSRTRSAGTVNDVVLAVIAGAFRDLLVSRSEDPDQRRAALVGTGVRPAAR